MCIDSVSPIGCGESHCVRSLRSYAEIEYRRRAARCRNCWASLRKENDEDGFIMRMNESSANEEKWGRQGKFFRAKDHELALYCIRADRLLEPASVCSVFKQPLSLKGPCNDIGK